MLGGSNLCFAHRVVSEATSFTEPADVMGLRVSQVRYTYRLDDIAPWAKNPVVRAALPKLARVIDAPQGDDEASLILTSEGWQHERNVTQ